MAYHDSLWEKASENVFYFFRSANSSWNYGVNQKIRWFPSTEILVSENPASKTQISQSFKWQRTASSLFLKAAVLLQHKQPLTSIKNDM